MKNKKIGLFIGVLVMVFLLVGCDKNNPEKDYVITKWHSFDQNVEVSIDNDAIVSVDMSSEEDSNDDALTGGEYAVFTIKGLKKGSTMITVNVINSDNSVDSSETYYFEVDDKLVVKLANEGVE